MPAPTGKSTPKPTSLLIFIVLMQLPFQIIEDSLLGLNSQEAV